MTKTTNDAGWYGNVFKHWPTKLVGAQPTVAQLATIHALGARPGKQALANAMALRDGGVTGAQIVMACGAPQLNKMRGFVTDGLMKFEAVPPGDNGHKVYKLVVTAKGNARIAKAEAAAKAAEANGGVAPKAKRKAKAVKVAKADTGPAQPKADPVDTVTAEAQPQQPTA